MRRLHDFDESDIEIQTFEPKKPGDRYEVRAVHKPTGTAVRDRKGPYQSREECRAMVLDLLWMRIPREAKPKHKVEAHA